MVRRLLKGSFGILLSLTAAQVQVQVPPAPWRGAGKPPCVGSDGGVYQCPPAPRLVAVRAGSLFDSKRGRRLSGQVVIVHGERITEVGSESQIKIPAGAQVIDLSESTVLPGLIDGHSHMFNSGGPKTTKELALLIAVQNGIADLRAGFTSARDMGSHANGYADVYVRNAINEGRFDGPRYQVATRTIGWSASALSSAAPADPLLRAPIHTVEEARAQVREQIMRGADWIKLFPTGDYSFTPTRQVQYEVTYPLPVLQSLIDEAHHMGKQ